MFLLFLDVAEYVDCILKINVPPPPPLPNPIHPPHLLEACYKYQPQATGLHTLNVTIPSPTQPTCGLRASPPTPHRLLKRDCDLREVRRGGVAAFVTVSQLPVLVGGVVGGQPYIMLYQWQRECPGHTVVVSGSGQPKQSDIYQQQIAQLSGHYIDLGILQPAARPLTR